MYTFFEFSVGKCHLDLDFFLARFARSMLKQWMIMSGAISIAHKAFKMSLIQPYYISATLMFPYLLGFFESSLMCIENCFGRK